MDFKCFWSHLIPWKNLANFVSFPMDLRSHWSSEVHIEPSQVYLVPPPFSTPVTFSWETSIPQALWAALSLPEADILGTSGEQ